MSVKQFVGERSQTGARLSVALRIVAGTCVGDPRVRSPGHRMRATTGRAKPHSNEGDTGANDRLHGGGR
ncbi:hypothetical protein DSM104329_03577 [Capillimicrobium parvum]|uniref:Uncharacterized protein n=1 Tax=Capillimicrobium parvum TaxID=2884022 RepID=A0A9E6Y033_9ACTN|nr:hypothetical protein DSM104329_03577 [Capillimicrobium parvum]